MVIYKLTMVFNASKLKELRIPFFSYHQAFLRAIPVKD